MREALEKDGWTITHDPYFLHLKGVSFPVDLGAEKMIAAEKANQKILVEIKSFVADSIPNAFHTALGQYLDYALSLEEIEPDRIIFLAIPEKAYRKMGKIPILLKAIERYNVRVITFEPESSEIIQWLQK